LEGALLTHPKIADAAVVPVYSEDDASELPRAYVVANTTIDSAEGFEAEVQEYMANRLASHKRLRGGVFVIDEIPKSASGKILRRVLRDRKDPLERRTRREAKL
jgi:4-coumarate--CoA ligase